MKIIAILLIISGLLKIRFMTSMKIDATINPRMMPDELVSKIFYGLFIADLIICIISGIFIFTL